MPTSIQFPETVACYFGCSRTDTGALYVPATSMTITIYDPTGAVVVSAQAMTNISTVTINTLQYNFIYYYSTASATVMGTYRVRYIATNGSYVSILDDTFILGLTGV